MPPKREPKTSTELVVTHAEVLPVLEEIRTEPWVEVALELPTKAQEDLAELSLAWNVFGCAVCGDSSRSQDSGWKVELHHTVNRSQGGHDSPLIGLCGELMPRKCHWRVTTNRLKIAWSDEISGFVWVDTRSGEVGICRRLNLQAARAAGLERAFTAPVEQAKARVTRRRAVPGERLLAAVGEGYDGEGQAGAEKRFLLARDLNEKAERVWMTLAIVVQKGMELNDPYQLGFESIQEWADAIGIGAATMSKLRTIGMNFAGLWETLPEVDRKMLSLEGLYVAALMRQRGEWDEQEALREAVAKPVSVLWGEYRTAKETAANGGVPVARHQCAECGGWHIDERERSVE